MLTLTGLHGKIVTVDGAFVKIVKTAGILTAERENTLQIKNIAAVEVKKPGHVDGFIRFSFGQNRKRGLFGRGDTPLGADENAAVIRGTESYEMALKMKKYIEEYKEESPSEAQFSAADEILKLKSLMDNGIISLEEFNATKRKLLGI